MLELEHDFRVLDVNARLATAADPDDGRAVGPERLERELRQAGIVRAVVAPPVGEAPYLSANNAVARLSVDRPFLAVARLSGPRRPGRRATDRLRAVAARRGSTDHPTPEDVERVAYDDRFHGFLLAPAADGLPRSATLDALADAGLPALVRADDRFPPSAVAETLCDRGVPTVLLQFGGSPLDRDRMTAAIDLCASYERLWLETSYVRYRDLLERGLREHPDRVVFGSGAPNPHPNVSVMEVLTLDVPENVLRRAFTDNPARAVAGLDP